MSNRKESAYLEILRKAKSLNKREKEEAKDQFRRGGYLNLSNFAATSDNKPY